MRKWTKTLDDVKRGWKSSEFFNIK